MADPMIQARDVVKHFGKTQALAGVTLHADRATVLGLLGPNGAGKTTMIRILTTLLRPDGGQASVAGFDVVADGQRLRSVIGLAGQYAAVDELLSGRENLELVGRWYHLPRQEYRRRAQEMLERLSLTDAADLQVKTYSGGMRRRLDIGASLIATPPVLFLDEPTTGLDPRTRNELWRFIKQLVTAGTTVLLTTQYMEEAEYLADRIVVLDRGKVIAEGTADELKAQTGGATLEARVADPRDVGRAVAVLTGLGRGEPRSDPDAGRVSIPAGQGTGLLLEAGHRFQEAGIALDDLGIRRPTLDEAFLALTSTGSPEHSGTPSPEHPGTPKAEAAR
jgi:ABC-2 type transport system ATP-binding protein